MLISKFVLEKGNCPINPFTNFDYFLCELVSRDLIRQANNFLIKKCDEIWVFGEISNGVLKEIKLAQPIKYFDTREPKRIREISEKEIKLEVEI